MGHAGLTQVGPLPPGISGVAALNPALATMMQGNPMLAGMMQQHGAVNGSEVPFQEGWLKLRGIPFTVTKPDIVRFFEVGGLPNPLGAFFLPGKTVLVAGCCPWRSPL